MRKKISIIIPVLVSITVFLVTMPAASALQVGETTIETSGKSLRDTIKQRIDEAAKLRQEELEAKKSEQQTKIEQQRAAISEKLSGERMQRCLEKEAEINQLIDDKHTIALKHLDRFKAVQTKLTAYADSEQLPVENGAPLRIIMDDKQVIAESMVTTLGDYVFSCESTSSNQPGQVLKQQVTGTKESLKQYRDAVKQYADAVKLAVSSRDGTE